MQKTQFKASVLLVIAAFIWGTTFVAQSNAMQYVQPFTFVAVRNLLGCIFLLPVIIVRDKIKRFPFTFFGDKSQRKTLLVGGLTCGVALCVATCFQQFGLVTTEASKAGFITTLYIVLVPVFSLVIGKRNSPFIWVAVMLSIVGLYLLCITQQFTLSKGDLLVIMCAIVYACHILVVDAFANRVDTVRLSFLQFLFTFIVSTILALIFEQPSFDTILACWLPLLYAGVLSSGVAFTLQVVAQKDVKPTVASLIMCLESVFACLGGVILLNDVFTSREIIGCVLMFVGVVVSQFVSSKTEQTQH